MRNSLLKSVFAGLAVTAAALLLTSLIFSFAALKTDDPSSYATAFAYTVSALSSFAGGFAAAKKNGERGLFCGLLTGAAVCAVMLAISLLTEGEKNGLILLAVIVPALLGGIAGRPRYKRKKRKKSQRS